MPLKRPPAFVRTRHKPVHGGSGAAIQAAHGPQKSGRPLRRDFIHLLGSWN
ncbi:hypothetical exported protein [Coxiella burnetii CbuK_Q154]|nr:hypothetical protein [Coxiella burnetii]ACJ19754.1 hypothetical exported protein [Coxiella burnetii CbuK_Q154]EDQ95158.1 hypothetical protein A35_02360 [Coxiella burnetii 'MSU Goat Q177']UYK69975.1 hypothetical protein OHM78_01395 [Coxiella burnetii]